MKIIETDNFNGDYPVETFLNLPSLPEDQAREIALIINKHCSGDYALRYWRVVHNDYVLSKGFTP